MSNHTSFRQTCGSAAERPKHHTPDSIADGPEVSGSGEIGVLSRTVVPSTTIRWIIPARIRHQDCNDVIFVGDSFVRLSELLPTRLLADTPARLDLGCRILAAKVFSHQNSDPFIDVVVKQEQTDQEDSELSSPPQILVLALDSCEIAFVYAEGVIPRQAKFRIAKKRLPACVSSLGQYGRHMAVDSKFDGDRSCTMAISPAYGQFGLLRTKPVPELCKEIGAFDAGKAQAFRPLKEERFIPVFGLILKLDFLLSPSSGQPKTVLALLVANTNATHLFLYSWDEKASLMLAKLESCGPHTLPDINQLPLMMIPSSQKASFTLVTESGLSVYDDVLSPNIRNSHIRIPQAFPAKFVGSCRSPLWAQWAKPHRHSGYRLTNDDFVLVREDGHLEYFEIKHNEPSKLNTRYKIGSLGINVDSAFAILEAPAGHGGDIYVVGGDMNDGAVYHTRARYQAESFQTITNLAPIRDMLIVNSASHDNKGNRIFVCSGRGEGHANVAEIRHGLEARIGFEVEQEDAVAATRIWILPQTRGAELTFLFSLPLQTAALRIDFERSNIEAADDDLAGQGLHMDEQTLVFGVTREHVAVQITPTVVTTVSHNLMGKSVTRRHAKSPVLLAGLHPGARLFATATMSQEEFAVNVGSISKFNKCINILEFPKTYFTGEEPSSILLFDQHGKQFLAIGTVTGNIHLLKIEEDRGPCLISCFPIAKLFPEPASSAVCSLVALKDSGLRNSAIACGTRNGWLLGLAMISAEPDDLYGGGPTEYQEGVLGGPQKAYLLQPKGCQHVGKTAVELVGDSANPSAALLLCNLEVYRLRLSCSESVDNFEISRVWWTNVAKPDFTQPKINAVAEVATDISSAMNDLESRLVCLSTSDILVASLSLKPSIVPRRMMVDGDPSKLSFSKALGKLVVAIDQIKLVPDSAPRRPARRVIRPGLQLLSLDTDTSDSSDKQLVILGEAGCRISAMLSWTAANGTMSLDVIIVGLYVDGRDAAHCDGRLICVRAADGRLVKDEVYSVRSIGSPIYSLARYSDTCVVVCAGNELSLRTFDISTMKFTRNITCALPSPAMFVHVSGRWIYATTARHSLKMFEVDDDGLTLRAEGNRANDTIKSATQFVGTDEGGMLATLSNRGSKVIGLIKKPQGQLRCVFNLALPLTITCLREAVEGDPFTKAGTKYHGSTHNGCLYEFTILNREQWKCLDFIARLAWKRPVTRSRVKCKIPSSLQRRENRKGQTSNMHISGDKIVEFLRSGPGELRRLLEESSNPDILYDESFQPDHRLRRLKELAEPVFGTSEDPVLAVFQWMQSLVGARN